MSYRSNTFNTQGMSGAQIRDRVRNDPTLNELYGWLFDGGGNGALIAVRAINAAYRAESIGDRQACKASGGFYSTRGEQCFSGSGAYDYIQAINNESPAYERSRNWLEENSDNINEDGWITEEDQALADLIEEIGQETYDEAVGVLDKIKGEVGAVVNDPIGAIRDIANNILTASTGVSVSAECDKITRGGPEWIKKCVKFGAILSIPGLEIPAAILGGVFSGVTIQDMEDTLIAAGKKWEDIKNGVPTCGENNDEECTPENILGDIGDWVVGKVTDVFDDVKDGVGSITVEGVLKKIGEFLPPAVAAVVYSEFKDKINSAIGVPVFLTTAEECESKGTTEDPNNPGNCLPITTVEGSFDCASVNRSGGVVNTEEDCGGCLEGYQASANGCVATTITCGENEEYDEVSESCIAVVDFTPGAPCNTEDGTGKYNEVGECIVDGDTTTETEGDGQCGEGEQYNEETQQCETVIVEPPGGGTEPCEGNEIRDAQGNCVDPIKVLCSQPRPEEYGFEQINWDKLCGETSVTPGPSNGNPPPTNGCPEGQTRNAEGICEATTNGPTVIVEPPPQGSPCAQQNRVENEDGSCGDCLPGYMIDPKGFDQCVPTGIPVTTTPDDPPDPEPTGGGTVGGGGTGMFKPANVSMGYNRTPELVVSNKPYKDYAVELDAQVQRLLTQRNKDIV